MAVSSALMLLAAGGTGSACAAKVTSASTDAAIWKTCLMGILPRVMKSLARLLLRGRRGLLYAASAEMISRDRRSCLSYQDIWGNTACERRDADGQEFGGDGCSIAKLLDLRLCAPFAESLRVERKLALTIKQLVGDLAHAFRSVDRLQKHAATVQGARHALLRRGRLAGQDAAHLSRVRPAAARV